MQSDHSVPVNGSENGKNGNASDTKLTSSNNFLQGDSPLSDKNAKVSATPEIGTSQGVVDPTSLKPLSEQEIRVLVDQVSSLLANAGLGENLSKILNYISHEDYAGLISFQKENPDVMTAFEKALQEVFGADKDKKEDSRIVIPIVGMGSDGAPFPKGTDSNEYIDRWLAEFRSFQGQLSNVGADAKPSEVLVSEAKKLYQPVATRMAEVTQGIEEARRALEGSESQKTSSADLLKNFSEKARKAIVDSLSQAQANLSDELLSNPVEATAFASEALPVSENAKWANTMLSPEQYAQHKQYRVIDSVFIGKEFAYANKMLHPPANLHPYLKWLLYTRNLTPRLMENYFKTRAAALALYIRAKEGHGNIRYRGQIYGAFLPFAENAAGNFELVEPVSGQ